MTRGHIIPIFVVIAVALAACASATPTTAPPPALVTKEAPNSANPSPPPPETQAAPSAAENLARSDAQGAVEFVVKPINLTSPGDTLDFDVTMDTHSADLSWDLAKQSALTTDTGLAVQGLSWPVGGGHHYEGTLTFPAKTADGKVLLDGAKKLTLTIRDTDVPTRVFEWNLSQ